MYEFALLEPTAQYCTTVVEHGVAVPVIEEGVLGTPDTESVLVPPVPQTLFAATETVTVLNVEGKLTVTALRLLGPDIDAPLFTLQV